MRFEDFNIQAVRHNHNIRWSRRPLGVSPSQAGIATPNADTCPAPFVRDPAWRITTHCLRAMKGMSLVQFQHHST
jgi:hypothetical protein